MKFEELFEKVVSLDTMTKRLNKNFDSPNPILEDFYKKVKQYFIDNNGYAEFHKQLCETYKQYFTLTELEELVKLHETPIAIKVASVESELEQEYERKLENYIKNATEAVLEGLK